MRLAILTAAVLAASPALAIDGRLMRNSNEQRNILIWRDEEALRDYEAIFAARAEDDVNNVLGTHAVCFVPELTRAVTADREPEIIRVIVVGGPNAGCRGLVRRENFVPKR